MKTIILDGIVASGKSFTLSRLNCSLYKVHEPVDKYRNFLHLDKTFNALELYYLDPKQNAVCSQLHIIDTLEKLMKDISLNPVTITERNLTSVRAFTQTMIDNETISEFSGAYILQKLQQALCRVKEYSQIEKIIFLDTDIEICLKRWQNRERREEMHFTLDEMRDYLLLLRMNYLKFYKAHHSHQLVIVKNNDMEIIERTVNNVLGKSASPSV